MRKSHSQSSGGAALVITVIVVAVLAVVAVAFMQTTSTDMLSSRTVSDAYRAQLAAEAATADATYRLCTLITNYPDSVTVWQNIGGSQTNEATVLYARAQAANTNLPARPGQFGSSVTILGAPLVSGAETLLATAVSKCMPYAASNAAMVNLNFTNGSRSEPLVGTRGGVPPVAAAQWVELLQDPNSPKNLAINPSTGRAYNPPIARFAYWMEDESFRVNVNTATNGARDTTSLGLSPAEVRIDGAWATATNTFASTNAALDAASTAVAQRAKLGGVFPTDGTAFVAAGLSSDKPVSDLRFVTTVSSAASDMSRGGFKRVNLNAYTSTNPLAAATNIARIIAAITNSNSAPLFGQRFYRLGKTSSDVNSTNAVTARNAETYLYKIAANIIDYLDADSQPTQILNTNSAYFSAGRWLQGYPITNDAKVANFALAPRAKPEYGIETEGTDDPNPTAAMGVENVPRLQEYAIHGRLRELNPAQFSGTNPPVPAAQYKITIDHYFEFWNPSTNDVVLSNAFLKVWDQPAYGPSITGGEGGTGDLSQEGRPFELPLTNIVFPAGRVTVLTTAPTNEINSLLVGGNATNVVSVKGTSSAEPHRVFVGKTSSYTKSGATNHFFVALQPRTVPPYNDYESAVMLGNNSGLLESFVGLPIALPAAANAMYFKATDPNVILSMTDLKKGDSYFVRGGSLRGNSSATGTPSSTEGDPRALNEQLEFKLYLTGGSASGEQTRFFVSDLNDNAVPALSTIGAPNANFVNPANWVDVSSVSAGANNAPLVVRNGMLGSIGELGNITDPARVPGTTGTLTDVKYSRGGGRTLRVGQPELAQWSDGSQTNASRTWASWRLADIFTTTNTTRIAGPINPNGILRDNGAAFKAALFGFKFQPSPAGDPTVGNRPLAGLTNLVTNMMARLTNGLASSSAPMINPFWERGEISDSPLFNASSVLTAASISKAFDRGREELVRRTMQMVTTRGTVFTVYAVGQALQVSATRTNVLSTAYARTTIELTPQFGFGGTVDTFNPSDATVISNRFLPATNYTVRVISTFHD